MSYSYLILSFEIFTKIVFGLNEARFRVDTEESISFGRADDFVSDLKQANDITR